MRASALERWVTRRWYDSVHPIWLLLPLAWLFAGIVLARRALRPLLVRALPVPVVVIGNLTVGGSGKTPMVLWCVQALRQAGLRPGVVSRGFGGRAPRYPMRVRAASDPGECGDEALLVARRLGCPVMVDPDRVAAARRLIAEDGVDVIVSDDGLQHYRLPRRIELCVVDGRRGLGNQALLPAGPLREPRARLEDVDAVIVNGVGCLLPGALSMQLVANEAISLADGRRCPLTAFAGQRVHAVAGIGDPKRFFATLRDAGIECVEHPFPDHHGVSVPDLAFDEELEVLMTEKDAMKVALLPGRSRWYVPVDAVLPPEDAWRMQQLLSSLRLPA